MLSWIVAQWARAPNRKDNRLEPFQQIGHGQVIRPGRSRPERRPSALPQRIVACPPGIIGDVVQRRSRR